ncbi:MAG TPA: ethylbenzene dehydrogenase-related protein [Candidatus Eisenbacteria bacterium]|jgi:mono/diheme cytochrome c family protein|nr:ethylbenzene dehydrogenase-related protein [Candidatus Eisenbacteria bacterium]
MKVKRLSFFLAASLATAVPVLGQKNPPVVSANAPATMDPSAPAGKALYEQHCAACHGSNGDGNGPASVWLFPRPRNFSAGLFKIQSNPAGSLPTDDDLLQTVTRGMPGSSMPSFTYLTEPQRREAVEYVKFLTAYTDESGKRINRFEEAKANNRLLAPINVPPEPPVTVQALAQGLALYQKLQCFLCHGETGAGDGPNAPTLKDTLGLYLPPRDFNTSPFRGGSTGRDLFLRTAIGLAGTPMAPFTSEVLNDQERWSLVHYVQSLRRKDIEINDILAPTDGIIHVPRVRRQLPIDPADPFWETMDPARIVLNPLWPEKDLIPAVAVRAVHDGRRVAILCTWHDPIADGAPVRVQDFQDAIALQFSMSGNTPFLGMGDAQNPVNLWQWKAGWQQEFESQRPDVNTVYVSMHADIYFQTNALYRTAEAAQNLLSQPTHRSPVEDANARGFGTMKSQPPAGQNVKGKGIWRDSHWNVVFIRGLKSRDADDVKLAIGKPTPIAFAVWDGQNRDRNGRKVVSNWHKLILEP